MGLETTETALQLLTLFSSTPTDAVFPNIPQDVFVNDLRRHLENPSSIRQGGNGTCGAAVLSKYMAEQHPVLYTKTAIELYTTGHYARNGIRLRLPESAYAGNVADLRRLGLNSVDAIVQGAFTNSQNGLLDYNPFRDGSGLKSFMYPGMLCRYIGQYIGVHYQYLLLPTNRRIEKLDFAHHFVIGIVHSGSGSCVNPGFPNHYIQIHGTSGNLLRYWSWGYSNHQDPLRHPFWNGVSMIVLIRE